MKSLLITFTALTLALTGCKKDEESAAPAKTTTAPADAAAAQPKAPEAPPPPQAEADYFRVLATHAKPKPDDPVTVSLTKFVVTDATFDPQNLEGGTATIELDLTSLESGSVKRDNHLRSADYLDAAKFAKATIAIDNVKKTGDKTYSADATVKVRDTEKKLPVTFEVLETTADSVRVRGEHTFSRHELGIGKPEGQEDSVASDLTVQVQLTLKKTS